MCVFEIGAGARLLCVFVLLFKFICFVVDFSGVSGSCVPRLFGVGGGVSRRLLAGFSRRSQRACDAAGRSVMVGFCFYSGGFLNVYYQVVWWWC